MAASSFLIYYPDVPLQALVTTTTAAYDADYPVGSLATGRRANYGQLQAANTATQITYDLGTGNSRTLDHFLLAGVQALRANGTSQARVQGSTNGTTWVDQLGTASGFGSSVAYGAGQPGRAVPAGAQRHARGHARGLPLLPGDPGVGRRADVRRVQGHARAGLRHGQGAGQLRPVGGARVRGDLDLPAGAGADGQERPGPTYRDRRMGRGARRHGASLRRRHPQAGGAGHGVSEHRGVPGPAL